MIATLGQEAVNFIVLMAVAFALLFFDLWLWIRGRKTFSESIWTVNQATLTVAFALGVIIGHLLTVPR